MATIAGGILIAAGLWGMFSIGLALTAARLGCVGVPLMILAVGVAGAIIF